MLLVERRDRGASGPRFDLLADHPLSVGVAGHLGQVGHADDLVMPSQLGERLAQGRAQPAADAGVDLVEDQRRHAVDAREHGLDGQRQSRSSPPEAILRSGRGSSPGLAENSISTRSAPDSGGGGAVRIVAQLAGLDRDR